MKINRETWTRVREDYIMGKGSLAGIARLHGLKCGSVEKRARKEDWTHLRREFEAAQLAKLIPPPPPQLPAALTAPGGAVSDEWLRVRQEIHYLRNAELLDKIRDLLDAKLANNEKPSADELVKLTSALSGLVSAEIALLGLNRRREKKTRRPATYCPTDPIEPIASDAA